MPIRGRESRHFAKHGIIRQVEAGSITVLIGSEAILESSGNTAKEA